MHTEYDTATVTNTLALYGVRRRSPLYRTVQGMARMIAYAAILASVTILPHAIAYALIPA